MDSYDALSRVIAEAARELRGETGAQHTMDRTVELAVELVAGCEEAGISLVRGDRTIDTPAVTGEAGRRVDELQYECGRGPCLDAIRVDEIVYCSDLEHETRWGGWGPRTSAETGVRSMLCFRLFTHEDVVGALNLYAFTPGAFEGTDLDRGVALAAHAAIAVAAALEADQLRAGMDARTVIGQAEGILMERFGIDPQGAFKVLARVSSQTNTKLREVAIQLVHTRETPGRARSSRPVPGP